MSYICKKCHSQIRLGSKISGATHDYADPEPSESPWCICKGSNKPTIMIYYAGRNE